MSKIKKIVLTGLLITTTIILSRFLSLRTPILTIGFSFVPIILSAILLGPKYSTFIATISDIIGALLFPSGDFFIGFTVSAFLTGLIYGLFLKQDKIEISKKFTLKLLISTILVNLIVNCILNTIWIIMIVGSANKIVIPLRIAKQIIMIPVTLITIIPILKIFKERFNKLLND